MGRPQRPALVLAFATPHLPLRPWDLTLRAWDLPLRARPGVAPMPTSPTPSTTPLNIWLLRLVIPANAGSAVGFDTPGSTRSRPNAQWPHTPPFRLFIPAALGSSSDDCMLIIWRLRVVIPANAGPAVGFATPGSTRSRPNAYQPHPQPFSSSSQQHSVQHLATPACHPGACRLRRWICHSGLDPESHQCPAVGFDISGSTRSRTNAYQPRTQQHSVQHPATPGCHPGECRVVITRLRVKPGVAMQLN